MKKLGLTAVAALFTWSIQIAQAQTGQGTSQSFQAPKTHKGS